MRGLTIIIAEAAPERLRTALVLAITHQALGGSARLFLQGEAVALVRPPIEAPTDRANVAVGLPTLATLIDDTLSDGVMMIACQSGLALIGAEAAEFDQRIDWGGMVGILADLGDDRLLIA